MSDLRQITPDKTNDLIEIANMGVGNSASRLSDLINHRCMIGVPEVMLADVKAIKERLKLDDTFVVAIHVGIEGDARACMFFVLKWIYIPVIVNYMTSTAAQLVGKDAIFTADFTLKRMAEEMTRAFSDSINRFLNMNAKLLSPEISMDTGSMSFDIILAKQNNQDEKQLLIHTGFSDPEKTFEGVMAYMLDPGSQRFLLEKAQMLRQGTLPPQPA